MGKFRKKQVVIEAIQWKGDNIATVRAFTGEKKFYHVLNDDSLIIPTLEGDRKANIGDFIIRGVRGELYPCKSDIFEATYESVIE